AAVLHSRRRAAIVSGMSAVLFCYLYVVLTNEDYALLIGSIGVFAILAVIIYLTRRVDWYGTQPAGDAARTQGRRACRLLRLKAVRPAGSLPRAVGSSAGRWISGPRSSGSASGPRRSGARSRCRATP